MKKDEDLGLKVSMGAILIALVVLLVLILRLGIKQSNEPDVKVVTVDSHEYVIYDEGGIVHKQNCKYCTKKE